MSPFLWPGQVHVPPHSPGRELPGEVGATRAGPRLPGSQAPPCGLCPSVSGADRSAGRRAWGGWSCLRPVSPARLWAPATACSPSGPGCEEPRIHPDLPPHSRLLPPSLFCQKDPVRRSLCAPDPRTCGPWPHIRAPSLAAGPMSGAPKAKDLGGVGPRHCLPSWGPAGSGRWCHPERG